MKVSLTKTAPQTTMVPKAVMVPKTVMMPEISNKVVFEKFNLIPGKAAFITQVIRGTKHVFPALIDRVTDEFMSVLFVRDGKHQTLTITAADVAAGKFDINCAVPHRKL